MKDTREIRQALRIFVVGGLVAVVAQKLIEPKVRKAVRA